MNQINAPSAKEILRSLRTIHLAMMAGIVMFFLVSFVLVQTVGPFGQLEKAAGQTVFIGFLVMAALLVVLSYSLHNRKCQSVANLSLPEKLQVYRNSMILKFAMLEGSLFLGISTYLLVGITPVIAATAMILLLLLLNRPAVSNIADELSLNPDELSELE